MQLVSALQGTIVMKYAISLFLVIQILLGTVLTSYKCSYMHNLVLDCGRPPIARMPPRFLPTVRGVLHKRFAAHSAAAGIPTSYYWKCRNCSSKQSLISQDSHRREATAQESR